MASKTRNDLYSQKMGELLLKGWRMLAEDCPFTGEVPLMQHPTTGRKFSIACGQYTDEMDLSAAVLDGAAPPPAGVSNPAAPQSGSARPPDGPPAATAAKPLEATGQVQPRPPVTRPAKSESDQWCEQISALMLKGWKMLGENCPATGKVPLMQHPTNGRKLSVATGKYLDEMLADAKSSAGAPAATAVTAVASTPSGTAAFDASPPATSASAPAASADKPLAANATASRPESAVQQIQGPDAEQLDGRKRGRVDRHATVL